MLSTLSVVAALGAMVQSISLSSAWNDDYRAARELGLQHHRPLAVFLGKGAFDWKQITREGQTNAGVQKLLAERYVRVYIDTDTAYGRELATSLGLAGSRGLVISDRTGDVMAFRHDGDLAAWEVAQRLARYSDPDLTVRTTESLAPPPAPVTQAVYQSYAPAFGGVCRT